MSGIFGCLYKNVDVRTAEGSLKSMAMWNRAYGNAAEKLYNSSDYIAGCFLERISDKVPLSEPVLEAADRVVVIDAVIYNREELITVVYGKKDISVSDEELLLSYIDKLGLNALKNVNGDFAGAIYDKKDNSLMLFRDHMGIRPLFYSCTDDYIAFSTDVRGLVALPFVKAEINEEWIYKMCEGYSLIGLQNTEFSDIFCVTPGSYMKLDFSENGLRTESSRYWIVGEKKIKLSSDKAYQKRLRELIEDSVKRRLDAASGKVGAELSGGLDSGVIDILINRYGRDCIYYSWSRSPDELELADMDERNIINDICKQENISCNYGRLDMGKDSNIGKLYSEIGFDVDYDAASTYRFAFPNYVNTDKISQTAEFIQKAGAKVIFTGHGGDEGVSHRCNPYEIFHYKELYHYLRYMYSTTNGKKNRVKLALKKIKYNLTVIRKSFYEPYRSPYGCSELLKTDFKSKYDSLEPYPLYFAFDPVRYVRIGGSRNRLDNVAIQGAYSGVRYLVPYLDYRVIDYAVSIPRYQYLRGRKNRYIFREAFKDIMPDSMYRQRIKEDLSNRNAKSDEDWFEAFDKEKKDAIRRLDRNYWSQYLNIDIIDKFEKQGKPTEEDENKIWAMYYCIMQCAMVQNLIDKVKG